MNRISCIFSALLVGWYFASDYYREIVVTASLFGLFAASVNFAWGYCGIVSLGSAFFFGIGAYCTAYALKYGYGINLGILMGLVISIAVCLAIGWALSHRKLSQIQFGLLTLAMTLLAQQVTVNFYHAAGGSNGISNISPPDLLPGFASSRDGYALCCLCVATFFLGVLVFLARSDYGKLLMIVRDTPNNLHLFGISRDRLRLSVIMISSLLSCIAGALYSPIVGIAQPKLFAVAPSMLVLVWIALGGIRWITSSFVAAFFFKILEAELGSRWSNYYLLALGGLFVVTVVVAPQGFAPFAFNRIRQLHRKVK